MRKTLSAACVLAIGLGSFAGHAENLQMANAPTAQSQTGTPGRGMSMAQVEAHYGTPSEKVAPVGNPPIARWVYPGFTVYFEGHHVIHAVATPTTK
jgi:hypothetical protein